MKGETILVVDDERLLRWAMKAELDAEGYTVLEAESVRAANEIIEAEEPDLVLLDQLLEDGSGFSVLEKVHADYPQTAVIMITAVDKSDAAVRAMKLGAKDYITKPVNFDELKLIIERVFESSKLERRYTALLQQEERSHGFHGIIASSQVMNKTFDAITRIAAAGDSTVLITGESGTGKEMAARAIHKMSSRGNRPMLTVNCASISRTLMESELFGHEKGSFTDARSRKKGMFELAEGGTLFLDEIGDLPEAMQAALLRVLEQRMFRRVGGEVDITVNVRFLAATNQSLPDRVSEGRFRRDLFYRLNVINVELPPLRDRGEDILLLADFFIKEFNASFNKNFIGLSEETKELFLRHDWPGNVRELRNVIERAVLMDDGEYVFSHHVELGHLSTLHQPLTAETPAHPASQRSLDEIEKDAILSAFEQADHNQSKAARILQISRDTLRYRMKKFGLS